MKISIKFILILSLVSLAQGCGLFRECADYQTYKEQLNYCVNKKVSCFEKQYSEASLRGTTQLAQNKLLYKYSNNYRNYDGKISYCSTKLTVDQRSGKITDWEYKGDCYMWGYCARYKN